MDSTELGGAVMNQSIGQFPRSLLQQDTDDHRVFEDGSVIKSHTEAQDEVEGMMYRVEDRPSILMAVIFGFQQIMVSINVCVGLPLLIAPFICAGDLNLVKAELVSTFLVTSGIATFLQTTIGVRLPILQGGNYLILPAIVGTLSVDHMRCPDLARGNESILSNHSLFNSTLNATRLNETNIDRTEVWQIRMRELQGAMIMASLAQFLLGASGILNTLLRFIGPITVTPVIMLIGLSLFKYGTDLMQKYWAIGAMTTALLVTFSTFMRELKTPVVSWSKKRRFHVVWIPSFKLFPILLSLLISWIVCWIMTATGSITDDPSDPAYTTRTDASLDGLYQAKWFFVPYPGQWGLPTVSATGFLFMFMIFIASMIESVGDYYACARICEEAPPPLHAINRGLAMEGFVCLLAGLYGSGAALTSYSSNIGAIAITKVGSRLCFQIGGLIFVLCGVIGKLGAALAMLPEPVLGALIFTQLAFIVGAGMSNLSHVDLNSSRNLSILGFSLTLGLAIPSWLSHGNSFETGNDQADLFLNAWLSNALFIGGMTAGFLDNLVPGTLRERGMLNFAGGTDEEFHVKGSSRIYDLPYIMPWVRSVNFFRYVPFMPTFDPETLTPFKKCRKRKGGKK
ncbi:solute carrier family 23 member 1-like isoform X1 [Lineus longissimus]|uniref:solute carrier family 23 member 1-like isoform X1 n=1 Tax=Lineus longissimus TaxID=88925 RepID=UPI002B4E61FA